MAIHRLNHAVLYVRNAERSARFYTEVLDFVRIDAGFPGAVFLRAAASTNDHDLGLFSVGDAVADSPAGRGAVGLYHLAWEVDTLADLVHYASALGEAGALAGASDHGTTRSLYAHDPDGIELEVQWIVPASLLEAADTLGVRPLDLQADIARFGLDTPSGTGASRPAPVSHGD